MPRIIKSAKGEYTSSSVSIDSSGRVYTASSGAGGSKGFTPNFYEIGPGSGTFTANPSSNHVLIYAVGGGGESGASGNPGAKGGAGGDGGFAVYSVPVTAPFSAPYTIGGTGNSGNPGYNSNPGNAGSATTMGSPAIFTTNGGSGGPGATQATNNPAAAGNFSNAPSPDGTVTADFGIDSNSTSFNGPGAGNFRDRPVLGITTGAGGSTNRNTASGWQRVKTPGGIVIFENDT